MYQSGPLHLLALTPNPSPTVMKNSTNVAATHSCLDKAEAIAEQQEDARHILRTATIRAELDGRGGAYPNKKYEACRQEHPLPGEESIPLEGIDCGNHRQNNHG